MSRVAIGFALGVAAAAVAGAIAWQTTYSREARIEAAYESCMVRFGGKSGPGKDADVPAQGDRAGGAAESVGKAMQDLAKGVTASMSGAVCGALREACRTDFEGVVCQNALAGFR